MMDICGFLFMGYFVRISGLRGKALRGRGDRREPAEPLARRVGEPMERRGRRGAAGPQAARRNGGQAGEARFGDALHRRACGPTGLRQLSPLGKADHIMQYRRRPIASGGELCYFFIENTPIRTGGQRYVHTHSGRYCGGAPA